MSTPNSLPTSWASAEHNATLALANAAVDPGAPGAQGSITDVLGVEVGQFTDSRRPTGCSVVIVREGAVAGVDVRGAAPGTRETDLLHPSNLVDRVHAITLAGGSAWGLDTATGVMRWLEEQGVGLRCGAYGLVPLVPAAVLFDLPVGGPGGGANIRPDAEAGYRACQQASRNPPAQGNVGAGAGALVGKLFGVDRAMKGGIGSASLTVNGVTVGALVAVNALGDVVCPSSGRPLAGARTAEGAALLGTARALMNGEMPKPLLRGTNTTIGVVATDAKLSKAQAHRLAQVAHDGLARSINPVHTMSDGDAMFALATGAASPEAEAPGMMTLSVLAAEVTARAVLQAIWAAGCVSFDGMYWPCASALHAAAPAPQDR
ncbi:P1 family peptidase [Variovorax sp. HJSM1_2]|uniref:P1 family peptidase n=1 Tax=Variovorax sp. HJSM1_2 TaxID=3366263 RepID=UPI003BC4BE70